MRVPRPVSDRLEDHYHTIPETGCWWWTGGTSGGYGKIRRQGAGNGYEFAHRVMYERENGPLLDGMVIMHTCDNPGCVNPDHLVQGTHTDNMVDMAKKGRARRFSPEKMREDYGGGMNQLEIAKKYGCSQSNVSKMLNGGYPNYT